MHRLPNGKFTFLSSHQKFLSAEKNATVKADETKVNEKEADLETSEKECDLGLVFALWHIVLPYICFFSFPASLPFSFTSSPSLYLCSFSSLSLFRPSLILLCALYSLSPNSHLLSIIGWRYRGVGHSALLNTSSRL